MKNDTFQLAAHCSFSQFISSLSQRGDIKIFDFGLAKELKDSLENDDGTYNLTGMTGSPRYMCNHVANSEPYNASCDVYSFCVMFWQMMALKVPYKGYNMRDLFEKVYNGPCVRPDIKASWHTSIKLMLKRGWSHDLVSRSTMKHVVSILRSELIATRNGDSTGLTHHTRRSTFIFRGLAASFGNVGRSQRVQLETVDSVRLDDDDDVEDEDDDDNNKQRQ
jgi:serine/threonine protein kinase